MSSKRCEGSQSPLWKQLYSRNDAKLTFTWVRETTINLDIGLTFSGYDTHHCYASLLIFTCSTFWGEVARETRQAERPIASALSHKCTGNILRWLLSFEHGWHSQWCNPIQCSCEAVALVGLASLLSMRGLPVRDGKHGENTFSFR